jgi:hypothetical protein
VPKPSGAELDEIKERSYAARVTLDEIADQIRLAFNTKNLDAFGELLAEDARWGDDDNPNKCRSRSDVIATFGRLLRDGVDGEVEETVVGANGIAVQLHVRWPNPGEDRATNFYHAYLVRDGLVMEIQPYDELRSAVAALSS